MKKLIPLLIAAMLILLVSCGAEEVQNPEESSIPLQESKTDVESDAADESLGGESVGGDESDITQEPVIGTMLSGIPQRAANSYRIAYTKKSALEAKNCVTNTQIGVTAIYDGSVTRFFDAVKGDYFAAQYGDFIFPFGEGFYNGGTGDARYFARFIFDKDTESFVSVETITNGQGASSVTSFYANSTVYGCYDDENGNVLYSAKDGIFICRELKGSHDIEGSYKNGSFVLPADDLGKYGLYNNGKIVIPFEYDLISTYVSESDLAYGNSYGVVLAVKDGRSYYFSSDGVNLTPDGFDCGSQPYADRAWVFEDGQGYIIKFN
jgi:hypothetical protein